MIKNRELDIIIVNWNSGNFLSECINSILESNMKKSLLEIIVVDNASTDKSLQLIEKNKDITIIKNKKNIGFGAACNLAFKQSSSKYKLLLNPDTKVFKDTLSESYKFMENNCDVDVLGVRHVDENNKTRPSCSRFPKIGNFIFDIIGLSKIAPKLFHSATLMRDWDHNESRFVDQVMGAYMFIRSTALDRVGFMDEKYFVYFEDMDLSYRINTQKNKIFYNADILIFHYGGGTSESVKDYRLYYSIKSRLIFVNKYYHKINYIILLIASLVIEPITRILFLLLKFKFKEIIGILKGYRLLYKSFLKQ